MALKTILNQQTDFTGEFPVEWAKNGLWRMNESAPDENNNLLDSSGAGRPAFINNWSGTTASMRSGQKGNYFRFNINNPATEQTYLKVANDGSIFAELGGRILCGGWMNPPHLVCRKHLLPDLQHKIRSRSADLLPLPFPRQAEGHAL